MRKRRNMKELNVVKFLQTNNNYFEDYITRSVYNSMYLMTSRLKYLQT
jgi:hypothetical protein